MIIDSYDIKTPAFMTPEMAYGPQKHLIDTCLVIFSKKIYEDMLSMYECEKIGEVLACNGNLPIWKFTYKNKEIGFYLTAIGSALASQCVIEVNWLTGAEKFIMTGSAGSLDGEATRGRYVIPTDAYRDEGMSYHYAPASDYITVRNADKVASIFDELHIPYIKGKTWTTDAFLRETAGLTAARKSEGCIAVEMEVAGVQSVCDFHGLELYNFLETGDVLYEDGYDFSGLAEANRGFRKILAAMEIALRV